MPQWFVRQQGKVFGPFDDARLRVLLDAGQLDRSAEWSESSGGPWKPLTAAMVRPRPQQQADHDKPSSTPVITPSSPADGGGAGHPLDAFQRGRDANVPPPPSFPPPIRMPDTDRQGQAEANLPRIEPRLAVRTVAYGRRAAKSSPLSSIGLVALGAAVAASVALLVADFPAIRGAITGWTGPSNTGKKRTATSLQRVDADQERSVRRTEAARSTGTASRTSSDTRVRDRRPYSGDTSAAPMLSSTEARMVATTVQPQSTDGAGRDPNQADAQARRRLALFNAPALDPNRIDVRELRGLAEELGRRELPTEDMEVVEEILKLTKEREWKSKDARTKEWGEVTLILPDKVYFRNDKGEGPWNRDDLSAPSTKAIAEIAKLAADLYDINRRSLEESKDADGM